MNTQPLRSSELTIVSLEYLTLLRKHTRVFNGAPLILHQSEHSHVPIKPICYDFRRGGAERGVVPHLLGGCYGGNGDQRGHWLAISYRRKRPH